MSENSREHRRSCRLHHGPAGSVGALRVCEHGVAQVLADRPPAVKDWPTPGYEWLDLNQFWTGRLYRFLRSLVMGA